MAGYTAPTPIQAEGIPIILEGHDLIAAAQTGSGKTAAFMLPVLARLMGGHHAVRALVLCPTRELAAQIEENGKDYARYSRQNVVAVYGGVPIGPQERILRYEGADVLVATPGRLLDLHGRQSVALDEVEILVLDEADRMVDMGFAPDLRRILKLLPKKRQTLMFSATMPREVNAVAQEALHHPRHLEISPPNRPVESVAQGLYPVPNHLKLELLDHIIAESDEIHAIVFARTKHGADKLHKKLRQRGWDAVVLHGDRSQGQRERALVDFKRGRANLLVATDIASRGIDVEGVTHVINYDVPRAPEDYVHRIGRTGRMHAVGKACTLVSPEQEKEVTAIERTLGSKVPRVKFDNFDYHARPEPKEHGAREVGGGRSGRGRDGGRGHERAGSHESRERGTHEPRAALPPAPGITRAGGVGESMHGRRPKAGAPGRRRRM